MDRVARWGPLARARGALKGGHFRNCQQIVAVEGGTLWRKHNFRIKYSQCRKTERRTLWGFQHPFCRRTKTIEVGPLKTKIFSGKKSRSAKKKWKGDNTKNFFGSVC